MASTELTAWIGAGTGIVGATTGIVGLCVFLWNAWRSQGVRLVVQPQVSSRESQSPGSRFSVRITNLSPFADTLERVGIALRSGRRLQVHSLDIPGRTLPVELPPRQAVAANLSLRETIVAAIDPFDHAFAITACGTSARSSRHHRFAGKKLHEILNVADVG